ncbi:P-loop containing nucleoside triphosphate hydrolase protein [Gloeophyllum trabeum ATCC 11539]|uniref:p-loop containing nucleoside triphosphate hydrolase protein n=1 Tax=Gloeophyllum trabeum (strain ATCC 11539 / FP-39264 / Madison 617) TaxID=670483 RepID=S7QJQ2_GLOTA|nr:P-loop containing nucleoside triphosphate hydrolase protein [Gloeophyllum trabeum ATCC 11539]EPQ59557.1 P-loop containing nucleoside triphosphate hydrolase protein [Gloeophyllum trabeum ATCC 11539]
MADELDVTMSSPSRARNGGNASTTPKAQTIWPVHIEVRVAPTATARFDTIRNLVQNYLTTSLSHVYLPSTLTGWEDHPVLSASVERIVAAEPPASLLASSVSPSLPIEDCALQIHVYQPSDTDAFEEFDGGGRGGEGEEVMAASVCELPSRGWEGLWDSLIYEGDVKGRLLDYIYATVVFSDADVDFNVVSWNRVVLLHGPPGTGKTSLCRALAQKLSIRLSHRYPHSRLLEINSHSLFSRWFSESGKLVQRLFSTIMEMVEDEETFVVVLIDEVESLTAARAGAMAGTEPSDVTTRHRVINLLPRFQVVNALLTQLDKLKHRKNVLIMSTSNLAKAIDSAFVDRADIIQYIDLPPREAIYDILRSCLSELVHKGIVCDADVPTLTQAQMYERTSAYLSPQPQADGESHDEEVSKKDRNKVVGLRLLKLAERCREQGMSGRALRRLPVLAHARYIGIGINHLAIPNGINGHSKKMNGVHKSGGTDVEMWLDAMEKVVDNHALEKGRFGQ